MYRSFVSLGRYTPKYFILFYFFVAVVNGIVSLISLSVFSLLVYRNARDFCVLILYRMLLFFCLSCYLQRTSPNNHHLLISLKGLFTGYSFTCWSSWKSSFSHMNSTTLKTLTFASLHGSYSYICHSFSLCSFITRPHVEHLSAVWTVDAK